MSGLKAFVILGFVCAAGFAFSDDYVICKNLKTVRTLRVSKTPAGCQTIYTKDGKDQVIGTSVTKPESCGKYLEDVRKNLDASGWKCRDTKTSAVSHVKEVAEP